MRRLATFPLLLLLAGCTTQKLNAVQASLVDLRAQPHTEAQSGAHDPLEETQLLYGERVRVLKSEDGWSYVEAPEQQEFTHAHRWQGYPGWIPTATLSPSASIAPNLVVIQPWAETWQDPYLQRATSHRFALGTMLVGIDMGGQLWKIELLDGSTVWMRHEDAQSLETLAFLNPLDRRRMVISRAETFLGQPYYWGGRSPQGIDCSGLTNVAYRASGVGIPRDAHEQYLRATRINALQPGDLIFLSEKDNPARIVHVMLYAGNGEVIEAPGTGSTVRRIAIAERLGHPMDWIAPGVVVEGQTVSFGSYLP